MATGWVRFEARARSRRIDKRAAAARAAIGRRDFPRACEAIVEIHEIDPAHPTLPALRADLAAAERTPARGAGRRATAVVAAVALAAGAAWWALDVAATRVEGGSYADRAMAGAGAATATTDKGIDRQDGENHRNSGTAGTTDLTATAVASVEPATAAAVPEPDGSTGVPPTPQKTVSPTRDDPDGHQAGQLATLRVSQSAVSPLPLALPPEPEPASQPVALATPLSTLPPFEAPVRVVPAPAPTAPPAGSGEPIRAATRPVQDEALARQALQQYRDAYESLNARAVQQVWPTVDSVALQRAFNGLASQRLSFEDCRIDLRGGTGTAVCRGTARFVPRVGSRDPREDPRVWTFSLGKRAGAWVINAVRAER